MMTRIHVKSPIDAKRIKTFLELRGERVYQLNNGCKYPDGKILEMGDNALSLTCDLIVTFHMTASFEE